MSAQIQVLSTDPSQPHATSLAMPKAGLKTGLPTASSAGVAVPAEGTFAALAAQLSHYLVDADIKRIRDAYRFADEAHLGQFRASGEPYITHPIAVATFCAGWRLDAPAIMAALMHDVMEDQGIRKIELIERFGAPVAELVDGLSKLDKLQFSSAVEGQAESFRKMLLAMSRDVRVILIKLADRLHNMRTLDAVSPQKRRRIARETLEIYAQIAHRLGLNVTYRELQELSFQHLHPNRYTVLTRALRTARGNRRELVAKIDANVRQTFDAHGLRVELYGREKTVFSIYRKMCDKRLSFSDVLDVQGFRLVVEDVLQCYTALGLLHQLYKPLPAKVKDYIAIPKTNGYQSLHTTVQGPYGNAVEFQIRTTTMHQMAESGIAAHWLYKTGNAADNAQTAAAAMLQTLLEMAGEARDPNEFFEHVKVGLATDSVYVFTPDGMIIALPLGSTLVDFAYNIHSDVGHACVSATVNGAMVPLRTELVSGDVVHIETAALLSPNPEWLSFVQTPRARTAIRHYLRNTNAADAQALGERMLRQALNAAGLDVGAFDADDWQALLQLTDEKSREDLWSDLGMGKRSAAAVARGLIAAHSQHSPLHANGAEAEALPSMLLDGSEGGSVRYAPCCHPIPGDAIIGNLGKGEGLEVHTADCAVARRQYQRQAKSWIDVNWADHITRMFDTLVTVRVNNGKGVLARVSTAISSADADIVHMSMGESRAEKTTDMQFLVTVRDRDHLEEVFRRLRSSPLVLDCSRHMPQVQ